MKIADDGNSLFVQLCLDDIVNSGALRDLLQPQLTLMMIIILAMFRQWGPVISSGQLEQHWGGRVSCRCRWLWSDWDESEEAVENVATAADHAETVYSEDIRNTIKRYISQPLTDICYV